MRYQQHKNNAFFKVFQSHFLQVLGFFVQSKKRKVFENLTLKYLQKSLKVSKTAWLARNMTKTFSKQTLIQTAVLYAFHVQLATFSEI